MKDNHKGPIFKTKNYPPLNPSIFWTRFTPLSVHLPPWVVSHVCGVLDMTEKFVTKAGGGGREGNIEYGRVVDHVCG